MTDPDPVAEAILRRRSASRFDPARPVPEATLARLLALAFRAPSQHNLQPWRFLVVRQPGNRSKLRQASYGHPSLAEAPVAVVVLGYHHPHRTHWGELLDRMKAQADLPAEAAARLDSEVRRDLAAEPDLGAWACKNAMLASATLMIAAEGLGLATTPIDRFDAKRIRNDFGIPADHALCGLIALGYASGEAPSLGRLPLGEVCFEEHFGQPWTLGEPD